MGDGGVHGAWCMGDMGVHAWWVCPRTACGGGRGGGWAAWRCKCRYSGTRLGQTSRRQQRPTTRPLSIAPLSSPRRPHHAAEERGITTSTMSQTQQIEHTDSISSQNPAHDETKKTKSKRPPSKRPTRHKRVRAAAGALLLTLTDRHGVSAAATQGMAVGAVQDALFCTCTLHVDGGGRGEGECAQGGRKMNACAWAG